MELHILLLKSSVILALFYLSYYLFLHKVVRFKVNRYFLMIGILLSVMIPLIPITYIVYVEASVNEIKAPVVEKKIAHNQNVTTDIVKVEDPIDYEKILVVSYVIISLLMFLRMIISLVRGYVLIYHSKKIRWGTTYLYINPKINGPMVLGKRILVKDESYLSENKKHVLLHERIHQVDNHWIDVLLTEILLILTWINPFSHLYKKIVLENLEFIADRGALDTGLQLNSYIRSILCETMGAEDLVPANYFRASQNKKRLKMMKIVKYSKFGKLRLLMIIPLLGLLLWGFSEPKYVYNTTENLNNKGNPQVRDKLMKGVAYTIDSIEVKQDDGSWEPKVIIGPVEYASVTIKGTNIRTYADDAGKFQLNVSKNDTLIVNHIEYGTKEAIYNVVKDNRGDTIEGLNIYKDRIMLRMLYDPFSKLDGEPYRSNFLGKPDLQIKLNEIKTNSINILDKLPEYKYGMEGYFAQLYSKAAQLSKSKNLKGTVDVVFNVSKNGGISNAYATNRKDENINSAAVGIVNDLSDWSPATQKGIKMDHQCVVTVEF